MPAADIQVRESPVPLTLPSSRAKRVIAVMRAELPKAAEKLTDQDQLATKSP